MVDARMGRFGDGGLGMKGDAEAGALQHGKIVGAVADSERLGKIDIVFAGKAQERILFRRTAEDRLGDLAGKDAVPDDQFIRLIELKTANRSDARREEGEPAGDESGDRAARIHCLHQCFCARRQGYALLERFLEDRFWQALQHGDAFFERALEIQLAAHGALGNGRDFRPLAGEFRKLVDAFLLNHRRIHIGDEEALAPALAVNQVDVDGFALNGVPGAEKCVANVGILGKRDVASDTLAQRADFCFREPFAKVGQNGVVNDRRRRVCNERQDFGHSPTDDFMKDAMILIAGPTASGKSAAALDLAERQGGEIVNADAMQVYRDLRIVTARPSPEEEARATHHLYGVADGADAWSAGRWAREAAPIIDDVVGRGRTPIIVGGTGLYFTALTDGLSPIPDIPAEIREAATARRETLGPEQFRQEVIAADPDMARLPAGDAQRLIRAWEVFDATGKPLSYFQGLPRKPVVAHTAVKLVIEPPRETLYARCDARAAAMLSDGAIDEVRRLLARSLDPDLPVMKALGVPEISAFLNGDLDEAACLAALQQSTRRFAKRQLTWFRNQAADWPRAADAANAVAFFA